MDWTFLGGQPDEVLQVLQPLGLQFFEEFIVIHSDSTLVHSGVD